MVVWAWGLSVSSCDVATAAVARIGIANANPAIRTLLESLLRAWMLFIGTSWYQIRLL